jgi:dTMP kinase
MFITFEGGEGAGKSTQAKRLKQYLEVQGQSVCLTREPGGTAEAEQLRDLLVSGSPEAWSPTAEALLMYAARDSHIRNVIAPALRHGQTVICDRFMDSTRAYQGYAGGCDMALLDVLEHEVVNHHRPNHTIIFDLDPAIGLARSAQRSKDHEQRFERKGLAFHTKLRNGFLEIARNEPTRCHVIEASQSEDEVFGAILLALGHSHG